MSTIKELFAAVEDAQHRASVVLENIPRNQRPGWEMAKKEAQERLPQLQRELAAHVRSHGVVVYLRGPLEAQQKLAQIAEEGGVGVSVDANVLYRQFAAQIDPSMGAKRQFAVTQVGMLLTLIQNAALDLDIPRLTPPQLQDLVNVPDAAATAKTAHDLIVMSSGYTLPRVFIEKQVADRVLALRYNQKIVMVTVVGADDEDVGGLRLFELPAFTFEVTEETANDDGVRALIQRVPQHVKLNS